MNQQGFVMILFVSLLPLLMLALFLVFYSQNLILAYTSIQKQCRDHSLQAQHILATTLQSLLKLNPQATLLRHEERKILIALVAAAGNPVALAALRLKLQSNRLQQKALRLKMKALQTSGEAQANLKLHSLSRIQSLTFVENLKFLYIPIRLHLNKTPVLAIAPNFEPVVQFEDRQTLSVKWRGQFTNFFLYPSNFFALEGSCLSTLTLKEQIWEPRLSVAKFY